MTRRRSARAVFMTDDGHVLLMKFEEPATGLQIWAVPGGGLEPDESDEEGLRREVAEETGASGFLLGPAIWTRQHDFTWDGRKYRQAEIYYLVRTDRFSPAMGEGGDPQEASAFRGFRWWSIADIAQSEDKFVPRNLHFLLTRIVLNGPPDGPFEVGV